MSANIFIDTNVFLRFLIADQTTPLLSKKAQSIFQKIVNQKITVQTNILVVAEIVYVLEKVYELERSEIIEKIIPLLSLEKLEIPDKKQVLQSLSIYLQKNIDFEDAYCYVNMLENGITKIFTFDRKHFARLEEIEILD